MMIQSLLDSIILKLKKNSKQPLLMIKMLLLKKLKELVQYHKLLVVMVPHKLVIKMVLFIMKNQRELYS